MGLHEFAMANQKHKEVMGSPGLSKCNFVGINSKVFRRIDFVINTGNSLERPTMYNYDSSFDHHKLAESELHHDLFSWISPNFLAIILENIGLVVLKL